MLRFRFMLAYAVALFLTFGALPSRAEEVTIHSETSLYHNIFVYESEGLRCIRFASSRQGPQSCVYMRFPEHLSFPYAKFLLGMLYLMPNPKNILVIGLGGGTVQTTLAKILPDTEIDTVEIDPAILKVAETYFDFHTGPKQRVFIDDGRVFVKRAVKDGKHYDMVMLDAFKGQVIPEHFLTQEFLREAKDLLAPGGIYGANTNSGTGLYDYESATYASVYGEFLNLKKDGNRVVIALQSGTPSLEVMKKNAAQMDEKINRYGFDFAWLEPYLSLKRDWDPGARILTDQYAPSNLLNGMPYYQ